MSVDRLYVGVHSLDQVIYGTMIGLWLGFYFHFAFREHIIKHIHNMLKRGMLGDAKRNAIRAIVLWSLFYIVAYLTFRYWRTEFKIPRSWHDNMSIQCEEPPKNKRFFRKSLAYLAITSISVGAYYGIQVHSLFFGGMPDKRVLRSSWITRFFRACLTGVLLAPAVIPYVLLPWTLELWVLCLFKIGLPALYAGFAMFGFSNELYRKFGLLNKLEERKD